MVSNRTSTFGLRAAVLLVALSVLASPVGAQQTDGPLAAQVSACCDSLARLDFLLDRWEPIVDSYVVPALQSLTLSERGTHDRQFAAADSDRRATVIERRRVAHGAPANRMGTRGCVYAHDPTMRTMSRPLALRVNGVIEVTKLSTETRKRGD